jgi:hypothetical protein
MSKFPATKFTGLFLLCLAVILATGALFGERFDTTHQTRRVDWPAASNTVEATFDDLPVERFAGYDIGVALDPSVVPPANPAPGIVIEAWNAETGSPLVVRTFAWDPTGPFSDFHYCGPGIWSLAGIDAAAKCVRIRATTTEATPTAWRSRTGLAIRRSGALTAEQNRRLNRWLLAAIGTPAAVLVLFITFLAELAARRSQPSDMR